MAGIKLANGTAASAEMTVDTDGNAHVTLPTTIEQGGFACMATENDDGTVLGTRYVKALETSEDYRLRVGVDTILFHHSFEGTNVARDRIQQNDTTATSAQTTGKITINSGASVTSGQGSNIRTYRTFPMYGSFTTHAEFWVQEANITSTNSLSEFGFGYCSGVTAQLTDGVFLRRLAGGQIRLVVTNNSVDVATADITDTNIPSRDGAGSYDATEFNHWVISVHNDEAEVWCNDVRVARIKTVSTTAAPSHACNHPLFARVYNSGAASAGRQLIVGFMGVTQGECNTNKPWSHQLNGFGSGAYAIQPGTASGPTVTRTNGAHGWPASATARIAGTWTATSAPALNSLGGLYSSPAISTLTSDADYPIFAYLNPAGTATLPGKTLYITGVRVGESCASAAASTNSIVLAHIVSAGATAAATTTADGAATVGLRATVIGQHSFGASDAVGTMKNGYQVDFSNGPLVVPPGTYAHFIIRPFGTVTSNTLVVQGSVAFIGYHE